MSQAEATQQDQVWQAAPLQNEALRLEPVSPEHYAFLRQAEVTVLGPGWRHRGYVVSPPEFERAVWMGMLCQFVAVRVVDDQPLGWFQAYNADPGNGHCHLAVGRFQSRTLHAEFGASFVMFVDYLLDNFPFHKMYLDVAEFNLPAIQSGVGNLFMEEGRLREHVFAGGERHDLLLLSLWRDVWTAMPELDRIRRIFPAAPETSPGGPKVIVTDLRRP